MPVLRYDVVTQDWVIFAPERGRRPRDLTVGQTAQSSAQACPFCPGHEEDNPPESLRVPAQSDQPWTVRIIPNKYPVLENSTVPFHRGSGLFPESGGRGVHEVVIESPDHETFLADQPQKQVEALLWAMRERSRAMATDARLRSILIFKNHGEGAGTSMRHPHWQMVATPVVPRMHRMRHAIAQEHFDRTDRCLYCDLLEEETAVGTRMVAENAGFAAMAPFASHMAFQIRILPKRHASSFLNAWDADLPDLARILIAVLRRLHAALDNPPFNLTLNSAPLGDEEKQYFLWHLDIIPRLSTPAGFEMGSGMAINTVMPEAAAEILRRASL
jgi:UDPglucose--hexose-1-phosphate uridylyltransferase